jgi:hypothetical protein
MDVVWILSASGLDPVCGSCRCVSILDCTRVLQLVSDFSLFHTANTLNGGRSQIIAYPSLLGRELTGVPPPNHRYLDNVNGCQPLHFS